MNVDIRRRLQSATRDAINKRTYFILRHFTFFIIIVIIIIIINNVFLVTQYKCALWYITTAKRVTAGKKVFVQSISAPLTTGRSRPKTKHLLTILNVYPDVCSTYASIYFEIVSNSKQVEFSTSRVTHFKLHSARFTAPSPNQKSLGSFWCINILHTFR